MNTIKSTCAKHEIANGYYQRTYWPEKYPERIDVILEGTPVSAIFSVRLSKKRKDLDVKELFNKVYVVPNDPRIQEIVKSATKPTEEVCTLTPIKFKDSLVFTSNPNTSLQDDSFILEFFPDEKSRELQIKKDKESYKLRQLARAEQPCILS